MNERREDETKEEREGKKIGTIFVLEIATAKYIFSSNGWNSYWGKKFAYIEHVNWPREKHPSLLPVLFFSDACRTRSAAVEKPLTNADERWRSGQETDILRAVGRHE